jgi:N-acetyl-anhydromuramyl-L-alanine amidase AmpD
VAAAGAFVVSACAADRSAAPAPAPVPSPVVTPPIDAAPELAIVDWPIDWSDERTRLLLEYRREHSDPEAKDLTIAPQVIVLHYTSGSSAEGTKRYFDRPLLEEERRQLRGGGAVNVSAHFLVDLDGTIYRLQPETRMARHCIGLNHIAIGVENVGDEKAHPLTDAQIAANAALVRYLAARHPITTLVGHHEVRALEGTPLFVERDPRYRNSKPDPGARFMAAVRARVADLGLAGPPAR